MISIMLLNLFTNSKPGRIILIFLIVLVAGLVFLNFFILDGKQSLKLALPVGENSLNTIPKFSEESDHLIFFLGEGEPVYAALAGTIVKFVPASPQFKADNIQVKSPDEHWVLSYLVIGQSLVKEGEEVKKGQIIAKAKNGEGEKCLAGGNLGIYLFEDSKLAPLNKEKLMQISGVNGK